MRSVPHTGPGRLCHDTEVTASPVLLTLPRGEQPETDLEVKRSHFLARAARTDTEEEARAYIAEIRSAHPTARHHCSAFIVSPPGTTGDLTARPIERSSDDGEPSGTAGQPILEVLRGSGLSRATVVVTRYFGGTLLGTGGLVRAYSGAAAMALDAAARVRLSARHLWQVPCPLDLAGRLEADLRALADRSAPSGDDDDASAALDLTVGQTRWRSAAAVLTLTTASPDPEPLTALLASLSGGRVEPLAAGSDVVELPA